MPKPIARWNPARDVWETDQACICGHSDVFSGTWPASGMTVAGMAYELPTSVPRMDGSGCSLLPTLTANDWRGPNLQRRDDARRQTTLADSISLLPTPTTSDSNGPGAHGDGGPDLRTVVAAMEAHESV